MTVDKRDKLRRACFKLVEREAAERRQRVCEAGRPEGYGYTMIEKLADEWRERKQ